MGIFCLDLINSPVTYSQWDFLIRVLIDNFSSCWKGFQIAERIQKHFFLLTCFSLSLQKKHFTTLSVNPSHLSLHVSVLRKNGVH